MTAAILNQTIFLTAGKWSSVCFPKGNQTVTNRNALQMTAPDGEKWLGLRFQIGISSSSAPRQMRRREPEPVMNPSNPSSMRVRDPAMNPSAGMEKVREKAWMMEGNGITKGSNGSSLVRWNTNQVAGYHCGGWSQPELITNCDEFPQASPQCSPAKRLSRHRRDNAAEITG